MLVFKIYIISLLFLHSFIGCCLYTKYIQNIGQYKAADVITDKNYVLKDMNLGTLGMKYDLETYLVSIAYTAFLLKYVINTWRLKTLLPAVH